MENLQELDKLEKLLRERGLNVERCDEVKNFELPWIGEITRHQVTVIDEKGKVVFDAICQTGSYGYQQGLLEIMDGTLKLTKVDDEVEGWLTADEIMKRLEVVDI